MIEDPYKPYLSLSYRDDLLKSILDQSRLDNV